MVDLALRAQFHRARSLWLGLALTRDLAWSFALLFASGLICFHFDRLLVLSPHARLAWGLGTLAVTGAAAAVRVWLSIRRQPDARAVAMRMERRHPDLQERLLSAVELDRLPEEDRGRFSPGLLAMVQEEAKRASLGLDFRRAVTWAEASPAFAACALAGFACLAQASLTPAAVAAWWGRMLTPGADIPVYRNTRVRVSPREIVLLRGSDLPITVSTTGRPADHAALHFRVGSGTWTQVALRPPFHHRLVGLTETTQFYATAGDGQSDRGTARIVDPPGLAGLRLRYRFPAYMARPEQTVSGVSGTLSVPAGTRVELALAASKPLLSASLEWESRQAALTVDRSSASGGITIAADTSVRVRLRDTDGFTAPASQRLDFHAVLDQAPEVRLEQPNGDQDVVADASVPLHVAATDDYGLRQLRLAQRLERAGASPAALPPDRLAEGGRAQRELDVRARWNLVALSLRPGDVVVYQAEATDFDDLSGPHVGRSGEQRLRIVDRAEMERRLAEGWAEWDRQLGQVIQEQAATRAAVRMALNPAALAEAERRQRDLGARADDLSRRAGELVEMARTNHLTAESSLARQERAGAELSDLSRRAMPEAADRIRDSASSPASRMQATVKQAEIERRLQALRLQARPESDLEALARRAEELARAQAELQGQSQRLLPQTLGLAVAELVPDQRAVLTRMSQSQTALQQTTGQFEETLQGAARTGPEPAVAASHVMRERAIPERQAQAARQLTGNTLARASVGQQTAATDLRQVAALLRRPPPASGRASVRQQAMARAGRQLERMMQQHEELMRRTAGQPNAAQSRQLARQERALRQQAARMSEQLRRAGVPSQSMQSAAQRMAQAERQLSQGTPRNAQSPQQQAQEAMRQMARQLQDPRGDRQADAEREQLRRALSELAQRQGSISKQLQNADAAPDRRSAAEKLAPRQESVSRSARSLQRKLPSETFRSAMGQARSAMERAGKALRQGKTGSAPRSDSRRAERLLQQMARALEEQTPGATPNSGRQQQGARGASGMSARELARRLADMKLLRAMEQGLRDETGEADNDSEGREERLRDLARRQAQTRGQTDRLGQALRRVPGVGQRVGEAAGAMGQAQRGLQGGSAGEETQGAEGTAVMRLTQAIGQGQRQLQAMGQPSPGQGQPGNQNQPQNPNRGQRPAIDSLDVHGTDEGGPRALVPGGRRGFGLLSPGDQQALRQGGREKVPADYADLIRRYYQTLSGRTR